MPPVGVVLAGGASRRMGRDKADLRVSRDAGAEEAGADESSAETLIERAVRRLRAVADEVVVAGRGRRVPGTTPVADGPGAGPAAGILGAAHARPGVDLLVLACDLPAVPSALLATLAARSGDWVVPWWEGGPEPLAALYRPPALAVLERRIAAGTLDLRGMADEDLVVTRFTGAELAAFGAPRRLFANLNRPEDLRRFLATADGPGETASAGAGDDGR